MNVSPNPAAMKNKHRTEHDALGARHLPEDALYGIHADRAGENFPLTGHPVHPELVRAYGAVKLACAMTNDALGVWTDDRPKAEAILPSVP